MADDLFLITSAEGGTYLSRHEDFSEGLTCRAAAWADLTTERVAGLLDQDKE